MADNSDTTGMQNPIFKIIGQQTSTNPQNNSGNINPGLMQQGQMNNSLQNLNPNSLPQGQMMNQMNPMGNSLMNQQNDNMNQMGMQNPMMSQQNDNMNQTGFHVSVHHTTHVLVVYDAILFGKPHKTESQLGHNA